MILMKKKHQCTRTAYELKGAFGNKTWRDYSWIVIPYDGENPPSKVNHLPTVSWSHGFTHYYNKDNPTMIGFCGRDYFEKNAKKVTK